jgi:hypothetical protein
VTSFFSWKRKSMQKVKIVIESFAVSEESAIFAENYAAR